MKTLNPKSSGYGNVKMVDFDSKNCCRNIGHFPCTQPAIKESGSSHYCRMHWEQLRLECAQLRWLFIKISECEEV